MPIRKNVEPKKLYAPQGKGAERDNGLIPCLCNHFIPPHNPGEIVGFMPEQVERLKNIRGMGLVNNIQVPGVPAITPLVKMKVDIDQKYEAPNGDIYLEGEFIAVLPEVAGQLEKKKIALPCTDAVAIELLEGEIAEKREKVAKEKKEVKK